MQKNNTTMARKTLTFALLALMAITAHAQHFDWVRSYFGPDNNDGTPANEVLGSVMDSKGNVYILGQFIGSARWDDDTGILPFSAHRNRSAVIARFSPNGELAWHKELYCTYSDLDAWTIRMMGDTAIMVYVDLVYPFDHGYNYTNKLYYFDTLLTSAERFPEEPDSLHTTGIDGASAFITMSLENGKVIEEHFLKQAYVKNDGTLLRSETSGLVETRGGIISFNLDNEGNVYLICRTSDFIGHFDTIYSPSNGNIISAKLLIDGGESQLAVPLEPSFDVNYQIIKMSPHFDSVIASTYIFDSTWHYTFEDGMAIYLNSFDKDNNDNIYISLTREQRMRNDPLLVKNSDSLYMRWISCMVRYSSDLTPTGIAQVTGSFTPDGHIGGGVHIFSTSYDNATNTLFLRGTSVREPQYSTLNYNGDTLNLMRNACWLRLDADNLNLISYGKARPGNQPSYHTYLNYDSWPRANTGSLSVAGNRVFMQVKYLGGILFQGTETNNMRGMGLFIWDYEGHELTYIDYNTNSPYNKNRNVHIKDSSLWLTGTLTADADFGSIHVNAANNSHAYLAKYTDTAFMTPYVYTDDPGEVNITLVEGGNAFVAYPNPFRQSVKIRVESGALKVENGVATAWLTDLTGRREQVRLTAEGTGHYSLDLTSRPQATYLLTLTTADGHQHTVRLLKQSDIFGQ